MLRKKKQENTEEIIPQAVYFTSDEKIENEDSIEDPSIKKKKPLMEILGLIEKIENSQNSTKLNTEHEYYKEPAIEEAYEEEPEIEEAPIARKETQMTENTDEKLYQEKLDINSIYSKFGPSSSSTNTVYIVESFMKALPDNLPSDIKLQSVLSIISASKMDVDQLMDDGNSRLEVLQKFFSNFTANNTHIIEENEQEIAILTEKINRHKELIAERRKLQEEQKSVVEFEIQKIENIINFVQNKKQ